MGVLAWKGEICRRLTKVMQRILGAGFRKQRHPWAPGGSLSPLPPAPVCGVSGVGPGAPFPSDPLGPWSCGKTSQPGSLCKAAVRADKGAVSCTEQGPAGLQRGHRE